MDNVHLPLSLAGCARRERKLKMLDDEQRDVQIRLFSATFGYKSSQCCHGTAMPICGQIRKLPFFCYFDLSILARFRDQG